MDINVEENSHITSDMMLEIMDIYNTTHNKDQVPFLKFHNHLVLGKEDEMEGVLEALPTDIKQFILNARIENKFPAGLDGLNHSTQQHFQKARWPKSVDLSLLFELPIALAA